MNEDAIVLPVYNEEKRAVNTVNDVLKVDKSSQIILVDDGSRDNSYKILKQAFGNNKGCQYCNILSIWVRSSHENGGGKGF